MSSIDLERIASELGPKGPGFSHLPAMIPEEANQRIGEELRSDLPWNPQFNNYRNKRGLEVTQAFEVFAHKYSYGSQELLGKLSTFDSLGSIVTKQLVEPLAEFFPSLAEWELDELSAQRYPMEQGVLTWHRDLARHPGIIAICNVTGEALLGVKQEYAESYIDLNPGDIVVLRAPGLFDRKLISGDMRPEHAVMKVKGDKERISVTARANSTPSQSITNFYYYNWQT